MTRREYVILSVMVGTVIYGGYLLLNKPRHKSLPAPPVTSTAPPSQSTPTSEAVTPQNSAPAAPAQKKDLLLTIWKQANREWAKDPFVSKAVYEASYRREITGPAARPSAFAYTGYVTYGGRTLAVINGREYFVGETLAVSDHKVQRITSDHVIIARTNSMGTVVDEFLVPLQRSTFFLNTPDTDVPNGRLEGKP